MLTNSILVVLRLQYVVADPSHQLVSVGIMQGLHEDSVVKMVYHRLWTLLFFFRCFELSVCSIFGFPKGF